MSRTRSLALWSVLAATLAATWWTAGRGTPDATDATDAAGGLHATAPSRGATVRQQDTVRARAERPSVPTGAGSPATTARMDPPARPLMPVRDARPSPPPPPVATAAPPPQAPPLPFRYLGRLEEAGGALAVFLAEGSSPTQRPHVVRAGERLQQYQVESITARGMTLIYLPLNQKQQLLFGNAP